MREHYENKMQAQLDELKDEIAELKQKAGQAELNLELEYRTLTEELHLKLTAAEQKLELLRLAHDDDWEEFKADLELSWNAMREMIKAITSP